MRDKNHPRYLTVLLQRRCGPDVSLLDEFRIFTDAKVGIFVGNETRRLASTDILSVKDSSNVRCSHRPSLLRGNREFCEGFPKSRNHICTAVGKRSISSCTLSDTRQANQPKARRKEIASRRRSESSCSSRHSAQNR